MITPAQISARFKQSNADAFSTADIQEWIDQAEAYVGSPTGATAAEIDVLVLEYASFLAANAFYSIGQGGTNPDFFLSAYNSKLKTIVTRPPVIPDGPSSAEYGIITMGVTRPVKDFPQI